MKNCNHAVKATALVFFVAAALNFSAQAQNLQPVVFFTNALANPVGNLVQGTDNNFYGVTTAGGAKDMGAVFKVDTNGAITILHSFTGDMDGGSPKAGLVFGADGNLYGTTSSGGTNYSGTLFGISTNGGFNLLISFTGADGAAPGEDPEATLLVGIDGNLYGTTVSGGSNYDGTVFKLSTNGDFNSLFSFAGSDDGGNPYGALVQSANGLLYGTTYNGGTNSGFGAIFQITTNGDHRLIASCDFSTGSFPQSGLVFGPDGNLYGTTYADGAYGDGAIFKVTTNGVMTSLYSFTGGSDGSNPQASLTSGTNGLLYGVAYAGGVGGGVGSGAIFSITTNGIFTLLYTFTNGQDGSNPSGNLILANDGHFYGVTYNGGAGQSQGTVFRANGTGPVDIIANFSSIQPLSPQGSLVSGPNGTLLGTTFAGGVYGCGTIFKIDGGVATTLYSFSGGVDGGHPETGLTLGPDGDFYGTAYDGGTNGYGTVYRITTNGVFTSLVSFATQLNGYPYAGLTVGPDGNLYGTTYGGNGAVYRITTNGVYTTITTFPASLTGPGLYPFAGLTLGSDGNFYGTAPQGGPRNNGTIYRVNTNGTATQITAFTYVNGANPGGYSYAALTLGPDGQLYGTTSQGGTSTSTGTAFKVTTNGVMTVLHAFNQSTDGGYPQAGLTLGSDGIFYGVTRQGGLDNSGTIFQLTTNGIFTVLCAFSGDQNGTVAQGSLIIGQDGNFYGTTSQGGPGGGGGIYRVDKLPIILSNPSAQNLVVSNNLNLAISANSFLSALAYQWYFNGVSILNATNAAYQLGSVFTNATGNYQVVVSGDYGSVTSSIAPVTIWIPTILGIAPDVNRQIMTVTLSSAPGSTNRVLTTTNLMTPMAQWQSLSTNVPGITGQFQITDTNNRTTNAVFYRLISP